MSLTEDLIEEAADAARGQTLSDAAIERAVATADYDRHVALMMRMEAWLRSPTAQLLTPAEWNAHLQRYTEQFDRVRLLGDALRPLVAEAPTTDALTAEILELFAA